MASHGAAICSLACRLIAYVGVSGSAGSGIGPVHVNFGAFVGAALDSEFDGNRLSFRRFPPLGDLEVGPRCSGSFKGSLHGVFELPSAQIDVDGGIALPVDACEFSGGDVALAF